ncbi:TPA: NEL-type E3 ubiquitin ligase domain-containing protein [Yersinia enterocolitica]
MPRNITTLNVDHNRLTYLPVLPQMLMDLQACDNQLTDLPALPATMIYLHASNNQLTYLPALPRAMTFLNVDNNRLTYLPALPQMLTDLHACDNQLTYLPALPATMIYLHASNNQLTCLPPLSGVMTFLNVDNNRLTSLPELAVTLNFLGANHNQLTCLPAVPRAMTFLSVHNNRLTHLPALPEPMIFLDASNNLLTHLPQPDLALAETVNTHIEGNPLPQYILQRFNDLNYSHNSMNEQESNDPQTPIPDVQETVPLHKSVADWLTLTAEQKNSMTEKWTALATEDNADAFSQFLSRLGDAQSAATRPEFKTSVAAWLTRLADDDSLREKTFSVAIGATTSCDDRVTLTYNQMQNVALLHDVENGHFDTKLPELISVGREMFRLEQLEQIAQNKVKTLAMDGKNVDEVEVYLAFQNQLHKPLELSTTTENMLFLGISGVTNNDIQAAEMTVKRAENSQFKDWLAQWKPWHKVLERIERDTWEYAMNERLQAYENKYAERVSAELAGLNMSNDPDAERIIGLKIMNDMDKSFYNSVTDKVLTDRALTSILNEKWEIEPI